MNQFAKDLEIDIAVPIVCTWRIKGLLGLDHPESCTIAKPSRLKVQIRWKSGIMSEQLAYRNCPFAVLAESRPISGDRCVKISILWRSFSCMIATLVATTLVKDARSKIVSGVMARRSCLVSLLLKAPR